MRTAAEDGNTEHGVLGRLELVSASSAFHVSGADAPLRPQRQERGDAVCAARCRADRLYGQKEGDCENAAKAGGEEDTAHSRQCARVGAGRCAAAGRGRVVAPE